MLGSHNWGYLSQNMIRNLNFFVIFGDLGSKFGCWVDERAMLTRNWSERLGKRWSLVPPSDIYIWYIIYFFTKNLQSRFKANIHYDENRLLDHQYSNHRSFPSKKIINIFSWLHFRKNVISIINRQKPLLHGQFIKKYWCNYSRRRGWQWFLSIYFLNVMFWVR